MDPNNSQPQGDSAALNKLEEDLKKLEVQNQQPIPTQPVNQFENTSVPEVVSQQTPSTTPVNQFNSTPVEADQSPTMHEIPKPKNGFISFLIAILILVGIGSLGFWAYKNFYADKQVACTMEAKICADGSSVGRVGPACEFEECPTVIATPDPTADWKTYTYQNVVFKYPNDWVLNTNKILSVIPPDLPAGYEFPAITFSAIDNPKNLTVKEYDEKVSKEGMDPGIYSTFVGNKEVIAEERSVAGISVYYMKDANCEPFGCDRISFSYKQKIYVFSNVYESLGDSGPVNRKDSMRVIFDQILSTFKFIEATPSASPMK